MFFRLILSLIINNNKIEQPYYEKRYSKDWIIIRHIDVNDLL